MTVDPTSIGLRVGDARRAAGMSLSEVAVPVGVHPTAVHAWERGRNLAAVVRFARLCETLGLSADDVLGIERRDES